MGVAAAVAFLIFAVSLYLNRRLGVAILVIALIIGAISWVITENRTQQRTARKEAIVAHATVDADLCPTTDQPIMVEFFNDNSSPIRNMSFHLIGQHKERETSTYRAFLRHDTGIGAGETSVACYRILPHGFSTPRPDPIVLEEFDWSVGISLVDFADSGA